MGKHACARQAARRQYDRADNRLHAIPNGPKSLEVQRAGPVLGLPQGRHWKGVSYLSESRTPYQANFGSVISSTMCFVMGIHLSASERSALAPLEENCAKHLSAINDIYSWAKEVRAAKAEGNEGAAICSAVPILGEEINLDIEATKRVLWTMIREWELVHTRLQADLVASPDGCSQAVEEYVKGVEYQMSGNEEWDKTTLRYRIPN